MQLPIKQLDHGKGLPLPTQGTPLSAGFDVCAAIEEPITMKPGERSLIPCGFIMALPAGYEAQIRPRSGLALKHGITVLNAPGTIDADYRGELKVILINHSNCEFVIERGMRIAQMVVAPVVTPEIVNVMVLPEIETTSCNAREAGGFGSTGFYPLTPESK